MSTRRNKWTDDHGADGLRDKFTVFKTKDGREVVNYEELVTFPQSKRIGADGEFVFVLRPESDLAAWVALQAYALAVAHRAPLLAKQIQGRLDFIKKQNQETS